MNQSNRRYGGTSETIECVNECVRWQRAQIVTKYG